jgi:hypothetical protein
MSPLRRHSGGRPRSAQSVLDIAENWGLSEKSARRLAALQLSDEAMAVLVCDSKRYSLAQRDALCTRRSFPCGMRAPGMRSRLPAVIA